MTAVLADLLGINDEGWTWRQDALCAQTDPEQFFPEKGHGQAEESRQAKRVCAKCPVAAQCLEWALANDETGIWAGTTDRDRKQLRRTRVKPQRPIHHGTRGGYQTHRKRGEKPCQSCTEANRTYCRAYYKGSAA